VLLMADSHGRRMREMLQSRLGPAYTVTAVVRPGAPLHQVIHDVSSWTADMGEEDVVVVMGGTNDIGGDKEEELGQTLQSLLGQLRPTLIIASIPFRYDRAALNHYVYKMNELFRNFKGNNIVMFDVNKGLQRRHYTVHGLHMNGLGKTKVCAGLAHCIASPRHTPEPQALGPDAQPAMNGSPSHSLQNLDVDNPARTDFLDHLVKSRPLGRELVELEDCGSQTPAIALGSVQTQ